MSKFTRKQRQQAGANIFHYSRKNIVAAAGRKWHRVFFYSIMVALYRLLSQLFGAKKDKEVTSNFSVLYPDLTRKPSAFVHYFGLHTGKLNILYQTKKKINLKDYPIGFVKQDDPLVSIIITVNNQCTYTFNCLLSLSNVLQSSPVKTEIILVNDSSADEIKELLYQVSNIIIVNNETDPGVFHSCNKGAAIAKGEYLLLLKNDIQATDDFITPLLNVFQQYMEAGAVGGKLVYPSGLLQEAGAFIFQHAHAYNIGRMEHTDWWMYNYVREVDYCSAALLMVRKKDWETLNGFDTLYAPAYYEDSDFCFALKHRLNKKVYYTPFSSVIHFEGISNGIDESKGIKKFQRHNIEKFSQKWRLELRQLPEFNKSILTNYYYTTGAGSRKKILLLYPHIPEFDKDSGANRMKHILELLCTMADVYLFVDSFYPSYKSVYAKQFQQLGCRIICRHEQAKPETFELSSVLQCHFDFIWITGFHLAEKYFEQIAAVQSTLVYDTVDLHYLRHAREEALLQKQSNESEVIKNKELNYLKRASVSFVVSNTEYTMLKNINAGNIHKLSNIHIPMPHKGLPFHKRDGLLFIGGFHHKPNVDAVQWLYKEIMPIVWGINPSVVVHIVGSSPTDEIKALNKSNFLIHGFVQDVSSHFFSSKLFICPLRYGAGVKGKIGQALEYNLPLVTTSVGAEGMGMETNIHCLIADDAEQIANSIIELYNNESKWQQLQEQGSSALDQFSLQAAESKLKLLLENKLI